jgi:hypothetical protein
MGGLDAAGATGQALGQVHALRADPRRERGIGARQQHQSAAPRDRREPAAAELGVAGPERPEDDRRAAGEAPGDALGLGRARRVGEEEQGRQGLPPAEAAA